MGSFRLLLVGSLLVVGCSTELMVEQPPTDRPASLNKASVSLQITGGGYVWLCRGTYVLRGFAVLTAKHCLGEKVIVVAEFGEERHPKDIILWEGHDLALLMMGSPSFDWVETKRSNKKMGAFVTFWTGQRWSDGMLVNTTNGTTSGARLTSTTAPCVPGNSGSLVVDSDGNIVGVVSALVEWWKSAALVPADEVEKFLNTFSEGDL